MHLEPLLLSVVIIANLLRSLVHLTSTPKNSLIIHSNGIQHLPIKNVSRSLMHGSRPGKSPGQCPCPCLSFYNISDSRHKTEPIPENGRQLNSPQKQHFLSFSQSLQCKHLLPGGAYYLCWDRETNLRLLFHPSL